MKFDITNEIKSGAINTNINPEKQNRHIRNSDCYVPERSYLLDNIDAQKLVNEYSGTGDIRLNRTNTAWINKEFIIADRDIGVNINNKTGVQTLTNRFTIHYSKTGTHVVPTERMN